MKTPGDNLLGSPGVGRQPEREQGVQLMLVLCRDQIRTAGERQELVWSLFLLVEGKSQGSAHNLEGILSPRVREEEKEEPRKAAVEQAAQGEPAVDQETWVRNSLLPLTNPGGPLSSLCLRTFDGETPSHQVATVPGRVR